MFVPTKLNYLQLQKIIKEYVIGLFNQCLSNNLCYHGIDHTKSVVERTYEIAANYIFTETELFILSTSAWFHDTGQLTGKATLHENRSVVILNEFFQKRDVENAVISEIKNCIYATKLPQSPKTLLQEILCDADTYNLGTNEFIKTDQLLRMEFNQRNMPTDNWEEKTLELLLSHKYFTPHCQALLNAGKQRNIDLVRYVLGHRS